MRVYILECKLVTSASLTDTFRVFEDPYNLARITPPWLGFHIKTKNLVMQKGAEIEYGFKWLGLPMYWKTLITEYEPPFLFVDEALKSPYKLWRHRHTFREVSNGTEVADRVEYALPLGPLGAMANTLAVRRQVSAIFEHRQKAIAELLGGQVTDVHPPRVTAAKLSGNPLSQTASPATHTRATESSRSR
jgi:ligand-binding SRPBCC domain-containing protein